MVSQWARTCRIPDGVQWARLGGGGFLRGRTCLRTRAGSGGGNVGAPRQVIRLYHKGLFIRETAAGVPLGTSGDTVGRRNWESSHLKNESSLIQHLMPSSDTTSSREQSLQCPLFASYLGSSGCHTQLRHAAGSRNPHCPRRPLHTAHHALPPIGGKGRTGPIGPCRDSFLSLEFPP